MSVANNLTGKTLSNRYEILRPLGEGGMGKVYLAKDKRFGKQVVVKVPTMEAGDKDFKDRFMREIASLATLEHAHIVNTVDWGEIEGIPFLVLRYLSGGSLRDRITDAQGYYKPMPLEGLNQWLPQIASALDFIHTKNWVHRDLKPDNILFDEAGNPYLADFGIAKALEGAPMGVKTTMGAFIGTPQYMAPEMHLGKGIGPRADQFGLAVLVYEALAGKIPFAGATPTAIFVEVMQGKARPIHELVPGIPLEKSNALMKGITKEPRDRYGSCVELANAVTGSMLTRGSSSAGSETPSRVVIPGTRIETPSKPEIAGTRIETPSKPEILGIKNETPTKPVIAGTKLETPSKPELIGIRNETPSKPEILGTKLETLSKSEINVTRLEKTPIKPDRKLLGEDYLTKEGQLLAQLCRDLVESGKVTKELFLEGRKFFKNNNVTEMPGGMLLEEKIETIVKTGHVSKEISEDIVLLAREILGLGKPEIADARMTKPTIRDTAKIIAQNEKEQESGYVHKIDLPKTMRGELDLNADWNENIKIVLRAGIISGGLGFIFLIVGLTIFSLFKSSGKSPTELIASIEKEMVPSGVSEITVKTKEAKKELTKSFQQEEEAKAKQMELVKLKQEEETKLNANAFNKQGKEYYNGQKYAEAIAEFTKAIDLDPKFVFAYDNRGRAYASQQKYTEAISDYTKAIELDPKYPAAYFNRGNASLKLENYLEAIADYSKAIELDPMYAAAYSNRGRAYANQQKFTEAIAEYTKAIVLDPMYAAAYYNRGRVNKIQQKYPEAIADYSKAIELDPKEINYYFYRGIAYADLKKYPEAIVDYSKAIELDPKYDDAYFNRGFAYLQQQKYSEAIADYTKAIGLNPKLPEFYLFRGFAYGDLKRYPEAITDLTKAIELDPKAADAYNARGRANADLKKYPEAIADYSKAIELDPKEINYYFNRGNAYNLFLKSPEAIADYTKAIELDSKNVRYYNNRGLAYADLKKYAEAIADYTKAIEMDPKFKWAYYNRGDMYKALGKTKEADADFAKAKALEK